MSNTRTRSEHEALGGSPWSDFDHEYPRKTSTLPKQETPVEAPSVDETEQGVADEAASQLPPKQPRSITLAVMAGNAVYAAWEDGYKAGKDAGYALGFSAGQLEGVNRSLAIIQGKKLTYDPGDKPF